MPPRAAINIAKARACSGLAEQVWALGRAHGEDVCAISGERIRRGDLVFRPRKTKPPAIHESSVIAAHHILDAPVSD
ncbi:DUF3331 domain-containing protein [Caballeronia calidae]|uniref:DUF3331 domain-containing protein n=1 Tax=Caballeronia calidae TaxID=1777139 RepID=UPI0007868C4C